LDSEERRVFTIERAIKILVVVVFVLVIVFSAAVSKHSAEYRTTRSILFETASDDPETPMDDSDEDWLSDIEENYVYGTNIHSPDTDGDGMGDFWEVQWMHVRDPLTEALVIDPNDPTDAFDDPDDDGYDLNRNGRIDHYGDRIVLTALGMAPDASYSEMSARRLLQNPPLYSGTQVSLAGVHIMDNASFQGSATIVEREQIIQVSEGLDDTRTDWLRVVIRPKANRPIRLAAFNITPGGQPVAGDVVDVQGVFRYVAGSSWIEVRGGEQFTNIMEYQARSHSSIRDPRDRSTWYNETDPTDPDTDDDGMSDGWEAHYGEGYYDVTTQSMVWVWPLDPTNPGDGMEDMDGDEVETTWKHVRELWVLDESGTLVPPGGAHPNEPVVVGCNLHEYIFNTDPRAPDTDGDSYPFDEGNTWDFDEIVYHRTDPTAEDTDGDGMWDGWEIYYNLLPTNASDRYADEDHDGLINYLEFIHDTHPVLNDTDDDIMFDGWEVEHLLAPKDPGDASLDPDEDLLRNWEEVLNDTNPRDPDTDGDLLSDYEELVKGFYVTADGRVQHYFTNPRTADTDLDDWLDDEDGDGNRDPMEEVLDGKDNDGDSATLQSNGVDDDGDGVADDGRAGIPAVGLPEGVDEEVDLNDYNEVFVIHTNASNPDTDGEGLDDGREWFTDLDGETVGVQRTQPTLSDTDSDGLTDKEELDGVRVWLPGYTEPVWRFPNPLVPDTDADGLSDGDEVLVDYDPRSEGIINSTDPENPDTDGDGMEDGYEFDYADVDGDGLPTWWEREHAGVYMMADTMRDADLDGTIDLMNDWDGDGLVNVLEYIWRLDPWDPDPGGTSMRLMQWDWMTLRRTPVYSDFDGDLMPDWWETWLGLDPENPLDKYSDPDHDFLYNIDEYIYNLDPYNPDTDGDGEADTFDHEVMSSRDAYDSDGDGISDWFERMYPDILDHTNPEDADHNDDDDNWTNYEEYIYASDPYNRPPTDPTRTSTDGDALADDVDPYPLGVLPRTLRPMNPTRSVQSLSPIRAFDRHGVPEGVGDMDQDGLNNSAEFARDVSHTNPTDPDTDSDGMPDGWEIIHAFWDPLTAKPNLSPLDPTDALDDPDWDGVNYSLIRDENGEFIISQGDWNNDGWIDPVLENETFCNLEEYLFGWDDDRDGVNERSPDPNNKDSDGDGMTDGWEALLFDNDGDGLANWFELVYGLGPFDPEGANGSRADPDEDGYSNLQEFWNNTNPRDPTSHPGYGSYLRESHSILWWMWKEMAGRDQDGT
jgi:hypothetical protein